MASSRKPRGKKTKATVVVLSIFALVAALLYGAGSAQAADQPEPSPVTTASAVLKPVCEYPELFISTSNELVGVQTTITAVIDGKPTGDYKRDSVSSASVPLNRVKQFAGISDAKKVTVSWSFAYYSLVTGPGGTWIPTTKSGSMSYTCGPQTVTVPVPPKPPVNDLDGANNASWVVPKDDEDYNWTLTATGNLNVATQKSRVFPDGTTSYDYGVAKDSETSTGRSITSNWLMPKGGSVSPRVVVWPQAYLTASQAAAVLSDPQFTLDGNPTCGLVIQRDKWKYGTRAEKALADRLISSKVLLLGDDFPLYISAVLLNTAKCVKVLNVPTVPVVDVCGPGNAHFGTLPTGEHYVAVLNKDGSVTFKADKGYQFKGKGNSFTLPAPKDSNVPCPEADNSYNGSVNSCDATWTPQPTGEVAYGGTNTKDASGKSLKVTTQLVSRSTGDVIKSATNTVADGKSFSGTFTGLSIGDYRVEFVVGGKVVDKVNVTVKPCLPKSIAVPAAPQPLDACGPGNAHWVVPSDTNQLDWTLMKNGHLVVSTKGGFVFKDGTSSRDFGVAVDSNVPCPVTPPVVTPPVVTPPVVTPPTAPRPSVSHVTVIKYDCTNVYGRTDTTTTTYKVVNGKVTMKSGKWKVTGKASAAQRKSLGCVTKVTVVVPPKHYDVCTNIAGSTVIPQGMYRELSGGRCFVIPSDTLPETGKGSTGGNAPLGGTVAFAFVAAWMVLKRLHSTVRV